MVKPAVTCLSSFSEFLTIQDEIGGRDLELHDPVLCDLASLPLRPDHLIVCTRGEQLESALAQLPRHVDPSVPVTVAAATLDDLDVLARSVGLRNPMLRMAVAFAAWPTTPQRMRVFSLAARGSTLAAESSRALEPQRDELAALLAQSGLPIQTAPSRIFRWVYRTSLAVEIAHMLAFRQAGWNLDILVARPELIVLCAKAMHEAALLARSDGGPPAWLAGHLPDAFYRQMICRRARTASRGFREVWRYHGPKINAQVDFCAQQLVRRAHGRPVPALDELLRRADASGLSSRTATMTAPG